MTKRRAHGDGGIDQRGENSFRLRYRVGGKRFSKSFRGTLTEARAEMRRLVSSVDTGEHVAPDKTDVSHFIERWLTTWAAGNVSAKTLETYQFHAKPIGRHLGTMPLQKLTPAILIEFYSKLLKEGFAPRTVGHVHRVLHGALEHAVTWQLIRDNPSAKVSPPRVPEKEIETLQPEQLSAILTFLEGKPIYPIVALAIASGARRAELLALRWQDVDLERGTIRIERSVEETDAHGLVVKEPKTKSGRRSISLPATTIATLRSHWKVQLEQRLLLGLGKIGSKDLLFPNPHGDLRSPNALSQEWKKQVRKLGLEVTFHSLRHTHASQLIAAGLDIITISRRLGHSKPSITLDVYGHLFPSTDGRAAEIMEASLTRTLGKE
jgi:integrase